jgi:hypothetical protein
MGILSHSSNHVIEDTFATSELKSNVVQPPTWQ